MIVLTKADLCDSLEDRIMEIEAGGAEIVSISDDLRIEMRSALVDLYEEIRGVVADDELFFAYCGKVYDGTTMK